ncbi:ROK family protein [Arcanobacterium hippocoleae]
MQAQINQFGNTLQDLIALALGERSYTRAQLTRKLGVSRPVLSRALDPMIHDGFVLSEVSAREGGAGRPVQYLSLVDGAAYIVGLSIGRNEAAGVLINRAGQQLFATSFEYLAYRGWEKPLRKLLSLLMRGIAENSIDTKTIAGTGVALPMSAFRDSDAAKAAAMVREEWSGGCVYDNIVAMAALAHLHSPAGSLAASPQMYVRLSGGVGSCFMWSSPVENIPQVVAGEFGHVSIPGIAQKCHCGNIGCLELAASYAALCNGAEVESLADFRQKLDSGDPQTADVLNRGAAALGFACAQVAMAAHPSHIYLGGEVVAELPQIVSLTQAQMRRNFSPAIQWEVPISSIPMDGAACAWGAVCAVKTSVAALQIKNESIATVMRL